MKTTSVLSAVCLLIFPSEFFSIIVATLTSDIERESMYVWVAAPPPPPTVCSESRNEDRMLAVGKSNLVYKQTRVFASDLGV
jgi:hypothetical protein